MNIQIVIGSRDEFLRQARKCRSMGSFFIASVLEAAHRQLGCAPVTAAMVAGWPGDPAAAALALRVNGALHALARAGTPRYLAALYRREHDDFDGAIGAALSEWDQFIANWIRTPTQTNEVARAAAIMAALMEAHEYMASREGAMPFELLELGSSCGLNLNLARYAYRLGTICAGNPSSVVRIEPAWRGRSPPAAEVQVLAASGIDLHPLSASEDADRERLLSFAWVDQPERSQRLTAALQIAIDHPPMVERGDAVTWLAQRLAEPQESGRCRAVVHSMFLQYLPDRGARNLSDMIVAAGALATVDRPLVWISFEWTSARSKVELRLTSWPEGATRVLATCHPYGDWVNWSAPLD